MFSKDTADAFRAASEAFLSSSMKPIEFSIILVTFDMQTVELGEASPNEDWMKPAENP